MPEGSSSAAPVTKPGPRRRRSMPRCLRLPGVGAFGANIESVFLSLNRTREHVAPWTLPCRHLSVATGGLGNQRPPDLDHADRFGAQDLASRRYSADHHVASVRLPAAIGLGGSHQPA
jgi:hypothetical protein